MGHVILSGGARATVPLTGIKLATIAEGQTVKLLENGVEVEFYVAKHNYESALNGTGRTLLIRKYNYGTRSWDNGNVNSYASSDIDEWLNSTYKNMFDTTAKAAIGTTNFYYTPGNGNNTVGTLTRSVFIVSAAELNKTNKSGINVEGSVLPNYSKYVWVSNTDGTQCCPWTRSPDTTTTTNVWGFYAGGNTCGSYGANTVDSQIGPFPAFTLPSNSVFDEETLIFKGVA